MYLSEAFDALVIKMTDERTAFVTNGAHIRFSNTLRSRKHDVNEGRQTCRVTRAGDWARTSFTRNNETQKYGRANIRMKMRGGSESSSESQNSDDMSSEERRQMEGVRARLEGLFGVDNNDLFYKRSDQFDGSALRKAILDRWGVQYDVQPQKRHGRVYIQIMWRYFGQQSFYMDEEEFASHCEAVAILLKRWNAVDYFLDYITTIKKRRTLLLNMFDISF